MALVPSSSAPSSMDMEGATASLQDPQGGSFSLNIVMRQLQELLPSIGGYGIAAGLAMCVTLICFPALTASTCSMGSPSQQLPCEAAPGASRLTGMYQTLGPPLMLHSLGLGLPNHLFISH